MATPHVAGIAALMLGANPALHALDAKAILPSTAAPMAGYASWEVGAGYADAYRALLVATGH